MVHTLPETLQGAVMSILADAPAYSSYREKVNAFYEIFVCAETCDELEKAVLAARKACLLPVMSDAFRREMKALMHTLLAAEVEPQGKAEQVVLPTSDTAWPPSEKMPYSPSMETLLELFPAVPVISKCSKRTIPVGVPSSVAKSKELGVCIEMMKPLTRIESRSRELYFRCAGSTHCQQPLLQPRHTSNTGTAAMHKRIPNPSSITDLFLHFPISISEGFVGEFRAGPSLQHSVCVDSRKRYATCKRSLVPTTARRPRIGHNGYRALYRMRHYKTQGRPTHVNRRGMGKRLAILKDKRSTKRASKATSHSHVQCSVLMLLRIALMWTLLWLFGGDKKKQWITMLTEPKMRLESAVRYASLDGSNPDSSSAHHGTPEDKDHCSSPAHQPSCCAHNFIMAPACTPTYAEIVRHKPTEPKPKTSALK